MNERRLAALVVAASLLGTVIVGVPLESTAGVLSDEGSFDDNGMEAAVWAPVSVDIETRPAIGSNATSTAVLEVTVEADDDLRRSEHAYAVTIDNETVDEGTVSLTGDEAWSEEYAIETEANTSVDWEVRVDSVAVNGTVYGDETYGSGPPENRTTAEAAGTSGDDVGTENRSQD